VSLVVAQPATVFFLFIYLLFYFIYCLILLFILFSISNINDGGTSQFGLRMSMVLPIGGFYWQSQA
jgi:hypothetical protein